MTYDSDEFYLNIAFVLTTIRVPSLLKGYAQNAKEYNHKDVGFIVIGDNKTPHDATHLLLREVEKKGFIAEYWDVVRQKKWLKNFPQIDRIVPYNSDNRRNIGFLIAAQEGAEIIISIDDDNYVTSEDYIGSHSIVGSKVELETISSQNNWFNPCSLLKTKPQRPIYSRGFPYSKRWEDRIVAKRSSGRIGLNLGLWLGAPDVDAVTNLNEKVEVLGFKEGSPKRVMLAPNTFMPINTQNTAFHRDILPCFYYVMMGEEIHGMKIDRYGDIWTGLFAKKVMDQLGDRVAVGEPLTIHNRNQHDLLNDLMCEFWGMLFNDDLASKVESIHLTQKTYPDAYLELAQKLETSNISSYQTFNKFIKKITSAMKVWVETCDKIL
jgi:hypothetical protein